MKIKNIKNIYLASPFFNHIELKYVKQVEKILRDRNFTVFSPREQEIRTDTPNWDNECFIGDVKAIMDSDAVVVLYSGNYSDSGTAWECGFAYALEKPVFVVHVGGEFETSNLMIHQGCIANLTLDDLATIDFNSIQYYWHWLSEDSKETDFIYYCNKEYTWSGLMT